MVRHWLMSGAQIRLLLVTSNVSVINMRRSCWVPVDFMLGISTGMDGRDRACRNGSILTVGCDSCLSSIRSYVIIDYIPPYLHPDTQVALRVEMEKPRSQSDVEGYIYTFEIRGEAHPFVSLFLAQG